LGERSGRGARFPREIRGHPPPRAALEASQDRLHEKALFSALRIPVAAHAAVDSRDDLLRATAKLGARGVLKTRRMGYDGKGQFIIRRAADIDEAWNRIGGGGLIYERFQVFSREVSIIGARSPEGEIGYYRWRRIPTRAESCATAWPRTSTSRWNGWPGAI